MGLGSHFSGASSEGIAELIERDPGLVLEVLRAIKNNGYKPVFPEDFSVGGGGVDSEVKTALELLSRPVENENPSDPFAVFQKRHGYIKPVDVKSQQGFFTIQKTGYVLTAAGDRLLDVLECGNSLEKDIQIKRELLEACRDKAESGGLRLEDFAAKKAYCPDRVLDIATALKNEGCLNRNERGATSSIGLTTTYTDFTLTREGARELAAISSGMTAGPTGPANGPG